MTPPTTPEKVDPKTDMTDPDAVVMLGKVAAGVATLATTVLQLEKTMKALDKRLGLLEDQLDRLLKELRQERVSRAEGDLLAARDLMRMQERELDRASEVEFPPSRANARNMGYQQPDDSHPPIRIEIPLRRKMGALALLAAAVALAVKMFVGPAGSREIVPGVVVTTTEAPAPDMSPEAPTAEPKGN